MRIHATAAAGLALTLVLGGGLMNGDAHAQPPIPDDVPAVPAETVARLQAALDAWSRQPAHRGVTAAVVLQTGAEWTGAAGLAGLDEPLRPDHLIGIASITKTMTGAVILQLVDEGVVQLDDPVGRWLPPMDNVPPDITVRQLLNHTSGLANYTASAALGAAIAEDPARVFQASDLLGFLDAPHFAPGERTEYTNTAFLLLGLVAEAATGRPILELYHQRLWGPRNLTGVFLPLVEEPPAPVAAALGRAGLVEPLLQPAVLSIGQSAFGLYADAITVARWGHALFLGDVVTPETQAAMRELVPAAGNIPGESGAGLGIRGYQYFDRTEFGHSGGMSFGSSLLLFEPESGATVVVLANQGQNAGHFVLAPELLAIAAGLR
ncbi:MAG: serine hydrolase domain-containing protein [Vicinamibacterales bacterium]